MVPEPVTGLTTSRVLTMGFVDGTKLTPLSGRARIDLDGDALVEELFRAYLAGLVIAALIVGAAMMARVETQATILGYPALAFIVFVVAGLMGMWLVITILRNDR